MQSGSSRTGSANDSKVRAKRLGVNSGLVAETRTIGAPMAFNVTMENVSRTGFLLSANANGRMPYQINTLIEMTVDPGTKHLDRPIHLLGRIVRTSQGEGNKKHFGVHIVQIDTRDLSSWEKYVNRLEGKDFALPSAS